MGVNLPTCCLDMEILAIDLLFPERMSPAGREFVRVHGLCNLTLTQLQESSIDLGNGMVKVHHRCEQLADNGQCMIYSIRPQICKDFDCSTRSDCACKGKGWSK